ncbi:MAG: DUF3352 domain-containing protein [Cyanobacteria bacterium RM1_2_2]|nr:DUF3352 domain-containing protein [Cyanobacteria bacterium RM1_2_2]
MVAKLFAKRKPALLLTLGSAAGFIVGGVVAMSLLQRRPTLVGMPTGAEVIPQDAIMTLSFSTDKGQWQQLRRFGTAETQTAFDQKLAELRDRLLTNNGLNYQRDIQPWVGDEITAAFLLPANEAAANSSDAIQPYDPGALSRGEQSTVIVMPIADPAKAQQVLTRPKVAAQQDAVDREYKGIKIREVHGQTERAYAAAVLDNRFVVVSNEGKALEQVIDTFKSKSSVAQTPGYSQALSHIATTDPFMQMYVNIPAANAVTTNNANQPVPPQILAPLKSNQGMAAAMTLEPEGLRLQGVSWLAPNSKTRFKVANNAEQMPQILPADALLVASGGNLKQLWQNYAEQPNDSPRQGLLNPDALRRGLNNLAGLDLDQDLINWMNGEFALALVSAPDAKATANAKAGIMLLVETTDRKAAEQSFQRLDELMKTRYRFQVSETEVAGKPATSWVSPFTALSATHGWLDGNVAFLTIGPDLASTLVPAPAKPLAENPLFQQTASVDLNPNNGHFFIEVDRLFNANVNLPVPNLPPENQAFLKAIRAIGVTTALQDGRTTRYDTHILLRKGDAPGPLPAPSPLSGKSPSLPEATPAPE